MHLLPKSPLDSSPLRRGTGRGRSYFEESDPKKSREEEEEEEGVGERERPIHLLMQKKEPS
jgi:hypothetical protein